MDYSKANYNALELSVSDAPQTELAIGGTAINLSLRSEGQTEAFTAELTTWQTTAAETQTAPNALVLTAASEAQTNVWHFGGEAYKLLYNSGVEYLVFASGDYIAVIPTAVSPAARSTASSRRAAFRPGSLNIRSFRTKRCAKRRSVCRWRARPICLRKTRKARCTVTMCSSARRT